MKQDVDKKLMINVITCSMLDYTSTSYDYDTENGVYKSTVLEPTNVFNKKKQAFAVGKHEIW